MADFLATNEFPGTGAVMQVEINFAGVRLDDPLHPPPYLEVDDVKGLIITPGTDTTLEVQVPVALVKINDNTFTTAPTVVGLTKVLRVYRDTDIEFPLVDFVSLQVVSESDLDTQARQVLYAVMEARDNAAIAIERAGASQAISVEANATANEALELAELAIVTANGAVTTANAANITAGNADNKANQALAAADAAEAHALAVEVLAAQAAQDAADAAADAAQAGDDAAEALTTANGIAATANTALAQSAAAIATANNAESVANGIAATAGTALSQSAAAIATANNAESVALGIEATADAALAASGSATTTANAAAALAAAAQPGDPTLTAIAATVLAANKMIYGTGSETAAVTDLTATGRALVALADVDAVTAYTRGYGRNRIINGGMLVAQRGLSVGPVTSASGVTYGGPDRFAIFANGTPGGSITQSVNSITYNGVSYSSLLQVCNSAATSLVGANHWNGICQAIEGFDSQEMVGQVLTLSFIFHTNVSGNYSVSLRDSTLAHSFAVSFAAVANTPNKIVIHIPAPPATCVVPNSTGTGWYLNIGAQSFGSYVTSTPGAWANGNFTATAGIAFWTGAVNNFINVAQIKLETGDRATPFENDDIGEELRKCWRYYRNNVPISFIGYASAGNGWGEGLTLQVRLRTTPTVTYSAATAFNCTNATINVGIDSIGNSALATVLGTVINAGTATLNAELF